MEKLDPVRRCSYCERQIVHEQCDSYPPEPAPESPEDRVRAKVESIGRDEARRRIEAFCDEPAPESEEPPLDWTSCECGHSRHDHPNDGACSGHCGCVAFDRRTDAVVNHRTGLEKAGVEPAPEPKPVDVAKAIVDWLDQNVSKCQHGYITVSCGECMGRYLK